MKKYLYLSVMALCLMAAGQPVYGQYVKKAVKSTVNHFTALEFTGEWLYEGVDVKFKSDKLLNKAGGAIAAAKIEKDLDKELEKMGFEPGVTSFVFNDNGTFSNTTGGKTIKGKYTYDSKKGVITLKYLNLLPIKADVSGTGKKMSLLFEANGFLSLVSFLGGHSGISAVKAITSIVNSYDGMMVGMEFRKQ